MHGNAGPIRLDTSGLLFFRDTRGRYLILLQGTNGTGWAGKGMAIFMNDTSSYKINALHVAIRKLRYRMSIRRPWRESK